MHVLCSYMDAVPVTDTEIEGWIKEEHVAMTSDIMERTRKLSVIKLTMTPVELCCIIQSLQSGRVPTIYHVLQSYYIMRCVCFNCIIMYDLITFWGGMAT